MTSRILVVDDDERQLRSFSRTLSLQEGWEVFTTSTADSALTKTEELRPDLVILDCDLGGERPEKDGFWVLRQLRKNALFKRLPVIFLTGARVSVEDRVAGLDLTADDYILKSADPEVIQIRVQAALDKDREQYRA
ncbi:MAG: response regulator [Elusimicrobiota bacterium]